MLEKINEKLNQNLDFVKELKDKATDKISELKEIGGDKIKEYIDELSVGLPLIEDAGFTVDGINIDLGIPPDISIGFSKKSNVSEERIKELIEENKDKKILSLVLNSLLLANNLQSKITLNKFVFVGVSIDFGLPPKVSLKYK